MYDHAVVCNVGAVYAPDMVAEVAERFMFLEDVKWSIAYGEYHGQLFFSLRTSDKRMNAGRLIRDVIESRGGSAGGHGSMAGARISARAQRACAAPPRVGAGAGLSEGDGRQGAQGEADGLGALPSTLGSGMRAEEATMVYLDHNAIAPCAPRQSGP